MQKLPNPPKSKRLTKKVAVEAMRILGELDYKLFSNRILERPALGIPHEWLQETKDRISACRANLHAWHDAEMKKAKFRKHNNKGNDNEQH